MDYKLTVGLSLPQLGWVLMFQSERLGHARRETKLISSIVASSRGNSSSNSVY